MFMAENFDLSTTKVKERPEALGAKGPVRKNDQEAIDFLEAFKEKEHRAELACTRWNRSPAA